MSRYDDCMASINAAAGRTLSDDEMEALQTQLQKRARYIRAQGKVSGDAEAAIQAADEITRDMKIAAVIEKRNAAINLVKRTEKVAWVQKNFGNKIAEGLEAILTGSNRAKVGAKEGVSQIQASLKGRYHGGLVADLERSGHADILASGVMDRDVGKALWAIGRDSEAALHAGLPKEAVELARIINKWQETARHDANEAGAWVGKETGYITRQSHDAEKIRRAGFDAWLKEALDKFDIPRMVAESGQDAEPMLKGIWTNLASGNHQKDVPEPTGFKGPGNLAKRASQDRVIHFKDADAWFDYNQQFGTKNLRESVIKGLSRSADSTGMMRVLGTNPASMMETIKGDLVEQAKKDGKLEMIAKLREKEGRIANAMAAVDGSMNMPGNAMAARISANIRSWEMLSKLGGMLLSQLNDVAVYGAGARYQGRGLFSGMAEAVGGLGRNLKNQETRDLAASLGVVLDNMAGEIGRIGSFSEAGSLSKLTQLFMKLNGGDWWVNRMRSSAALGMSHHMALQAEKDWAHIGPEYQRVLGLYGIEEKDWDAIRASAAKEVDGKRYIVPEKVGDSEAQDKLRNYLTDQTSILALEPDAKTKALLLQGTRPGTWTGEMARFLMQFKSFTGAYMQRVVGRELYGRGYEGDSLWGALTHGNGEFTGMAQLIVTTTLLGYGSMALKDLVKGRVPADPIASPGDAAKTLLAAMVQGGGAGIYGDFLFGQASRMGSGTVESLAGPAISSAARFVDLYHKAIAGEDVQSHLVSEVLNNTPMVNLFYTRMALDYLIVYRMQEQLNPGYLRRMERNVEQQQGKEFMLKPSQVIQ